MPDFTVRGNPGAIRSRAALTSEKGSLFDDTGEALAKIDVSGWTGRAADRFREAHDLEPERWFEAGNGFRRAGAALAAYAEAVERAQAVAEWSREEHARGERATEEYRGWFDSESHRLRSGLADGTYSSITLPVWDDPGAEIRSNAVAELEAARTTLENAAQVCAGEVRAGCAAAPEEPAWWESGLKFVGGIFQGAGEALWDIATMLPFSPANLVQDAWKLATGDLTPEELAKTYELDVETAVGMWDALREDPVEFGKNLGKGLLDWDTWADDPARAIGHLVPDAIAAVATGGAATAATRGAGSIDDIADGMRAIDRMGDAADLRHLDDLTDLGRLDDLGAAGRFDDVPEAPQGTWRSLDDPALEGWLDDVTALHPELSREGLRGLWDYTTDPGYSAMNGELRHPVPDPAIQARIDATNRGISELPAEPGTSLRATNLPDHVVDQIEETGRYSDPAFSSSTLDPDVAEGFMDPAGNNPTRITIEGQTGVDVRPFSAARAEAEILFRNGTEFEVVSSMVGPDGVRNLVIREVP